MPKLNAVAIPAGVDEAVVCRQLFNEFNLEIDGGLGAFKRKTWRIGLMGASSKLNNVMLFLSVLEKCLVEQGLKFERGANIAAAMEEASQVE